MCRGSRHRGAGPVPALVSPSGMLLVGHVLMLVAMAGAMATRPHEYVHR